MAVDYREFSPPSDLRRHVECLWWLHDPDPVHTVQTIYPDGRCELIAHLGRPMQLLQLDGSSSAQATTLFAAQQRQAIRLRATGEVACIGLRLRPAASALVAGRALPSLRDRIVDLA
nr:AraC family transcriptional regulator [Lysobacter sp.]